MKIPSLGNCLAKAGPSASSIQGGDHENPFPCRIFLIGRLKSAPDLLGEQLEDLHFGVAVSGDELPVGSGSYRELETPVEVRAEVDVKFGAGAMLARREDEAHQLADEEAERRYRLDIEREIFASGDDDFLPPGAASDERTDLISEAAQQGEDLDIILLIVRTGLSHGAQTDLPAEESVASCHSLRFEAEETGNKLQLIAEAMLAPLVVRDELTRGRGRRY